MGTRVAFDDTFGKKSIIFKMMLNINTYNRPGIAIFGCKGNLERITPRNRIILLHISERKPNPGFPIPNSNFKMNTKVFFWRG